MTDLIVEYGDKRATIRYDILASTTLDTRADKDTAASGTWSVQSSSNSCRLDFMRVIIA